jgi:cytochrome c oxidase subunit 2
MNDSFQFFPDQASSVAPRVDALYLFLISVTVFFTVLIFCAIVFLALYYRRSARRPRPQSRPKGKVWLLEAAWIAIPLVLTMMMFFWGARLYSEMQSMPQNAIEIHVVAKQWMWKVQHPQGRSEINELHIPVGQPVRVHLISEDVIHSFFIPAFRVKMDVLPERYTSIWFEATRPGRYRLYCAEYCGTDHANMAGRVYAMTPAEYAAWLGGVVAEPPREAGQALFAQFRCHTCHENGAGYGPALAGLYGRRAALASGHVVTADENYLRESIVNPLAKLKPGYQPLMPSYKEQLTEPQLNQLIEYIKSLPAGDISPDPS